MAAPEISMTLSNVSRRELLAAAVTAPIAAVSPAYCEGEVTVADPIEQLWRNRQRLHAHASALCRLWGDLETRLIREVGFPKVTVPSPGAPQPACAMTHAQIDEVLGSCDATSDAKVQLHAQLADHQARWDVEAERIGFHRADRNQLAAWKAEAAATNKIFDTPATTLRGVEIKIAVMLDLCRTGSDVPDFPLPQLRSTLADVRRLRRRPDVPAD